MGSKRRRSKQQIKEEKLAALQKEQEIQAKLAQFDQMQAALQQSEKERLDMTNKTEEVQKMLDNGLLKINPDGNISIVEDPAEAEYIRSEVSKSKYQQSQNGDDQSIQQQEMGIINGSGGDGLMQ